MLSFLNRYVLGPLTPVILLFAGGILTIRIGRILLAHPKKAFGALSWRQGERNGSSLSSMLTALAGTLGVGNITGVACAITAGGAGALFWMWVSAFAVMLIKYAEIVLVCTFRVRDKNGETVGSTPHTIALGLKKPLFAAFFAVLLLLASFGVGNMTQSSAAAETASEFLSIPPLLFGLLFSAMLYIILRGGGQRIMRFATYLIPPLTGIYIVLSLAVLVRSRHLLGGIMEQIIKSAFTPQAGVSGVFGYLTMASLRIGTARGIFSNEAGCGTAPCAHAASHAKPAKQGMFGILEVFVDTILLCTLTGFVVLVSKDALAAYDGTRLAIRAFARVLGDGVIPILSLSVILYALASAVAWAYYGLQALAFLKKGTAAEKGYRLLYSGCGLLGALVDMGLIYELTDFMICLMTLLNVTVILRLRGTVRAQTQLYFEK